MWRFAAYLAAGVVGIAVFGMAGTAVVRGRLDSTACDTCGGAALKDLPEARLLPAGDVVAHDYTVDSGELTTADPAYVREVDTSHSVAAVTGYYEGALLAAGWHRVRAGEATANTGIVGLGGTPVAWAKGNLRLQLTFPIDVAALTAYGTPPARTTRQRYTVTLARVD